MREKMLVKLAHARSWDGIDFTEILCDRSKSQRKRLIFIIMRLVKDGK